MLSLTARGLPIARAESLDYELCSLEVRFLRLILILGEHGLALSEIEPRILFLSV